jgi:hypothetical protein
MQLLVSLRKLFACITIRIYSVHGGMEKIVPLVLILITLHVQQQPKQTCLTNKILSRHKDCCLGLSQGILRIFEWGGQLQKRDMIYAEKKK